MSHNSKMYLGTGLDGIALLEGGSYVRGASRTCQFKSLSSRCAELASDTPDPLPKTMLILRRGISLFVVIITSGVTHTAYEGGTFRAGPCMNGERGSRL